jgi:lipoate-protein ligase A
MAPEYQQLTIEEFRDTLAREILGVTDLKQAKTYQLDDEARAGIAELNQQYFKNWDWIYGQSPAFTIKQRRHFDAGTVEFQLNVDAGRIKTVTIYGDFFGAQPVDPVIDHLIGVKYERQAIATALAPLDLSQYFGNIDRDQLIDLLVAP